MLPVYLINDQKNPLVYENKYILYSWGKILSQIMIDTGFTKIDPTYEIHYYLNLLDNLIQILIENNYYLNNISKDEALAKITKNSFSNKNNSENIWNEILYNKQFFIEKYTNWQYLNYLYDFNCIINNNLSHKEFIKILFENGFTYALKM